MSHFEYNCITCGEIFAGDKLHYQCKECLAKSKKDDSPLGLLLIQYDYEKIKNKGIESWDDILPYKNKESLPNLRIGQTPLYKWKSDHFFQDLETKGFPKLNFEIVLKDEGLNPTNSLKDRASAIVSAIAKENNISKIVTASTGNAASSLSGICAANNQEAIVIVPKKTPKAKLIQSLQFGAKVIAVDGTYDDCFDLSMELTKKFGFYNRNTAINPFTIEGKKTVILEIYDQLQQSLPDRIYVPSGDGAIVSGVFKAIYDLNELGLIDEIPEVVIVQAEGSDSIIRKLHSDDFKPEKCETIADSIAVEIPRAFEMVKVFSEHYKSSFILVSDDQILAAQKMLSSNTGVFCEPSSAAAFAGLLTDWISNKINENDRVAVICTGSGLKDIENAGLSVELPTPIKADINKIEKLLI